MTSQSRSIGAADVWADQGETFPQNAARDEQTSVLDGRLVADFRRATQPLSLTATPGDQSTHKIRTAQARSHGYQVPRVVATPGVASGSSRERRLRVRSPTSCKRPCLVLSVLAADLRRAKQLPCLGTTTIQRVEFEDWGAWVVPGSAPRAGIDVPGANVATQGRKRAPNKKVGRPRSLPLRPALEFRDHIFAVSPRPHRASGYQRRRTAATSPASSIIDDADDFNSSASVELFPRCRRSPPPTSCTPASVARRLRLHLHRVAPSSPSRAASDSDSASIAMAFHQQLARVWYQGRLPNRCFMAEVPDWMQLADDDMVFPSGDLTAGAGIGFKCIKFSSYEHFSDAVHKFWNQYAQVQAQHRPGLRVIVMPYTPVADAHQLHADVLHPDLLPISFAETIAHPLAADDGEPQIQDGAEEQEDDEDGPELVIWDERDAAIALADLDVNVNFTVANYGLLWAKAERFCLSTFMNDTLEDLLARLTFCDEHLPQPTQALLAVLQEDLLRARQQLIFAMVQNRSNPHDVIRSIFPVMHNQVYEDCVHCDPNIEEGAKVDSQETMDRLDDALVDMGIDQYNGNLTVDQARFQLMFAEGVLEGRRYEHSIIQRFNLAKDHFRQALLPLTNELLGVRHRPTVMGGPFFPSSKQMRDELLECYTAARSLAQFVMSIELLSKILS
ncbi:hypothetical protein EJB05_40232, partial [Eragrostis curvula]